VALVSARTARNLLDLGPSRAHVMPVGTSSRPTRSSLATSRRAVGRSPCKSKFLAVGSVVPVPWCQPHVGASATQSGNPSDGPYGPRAPFRSGQTRVGGRDPDYCRRGREHPSRGHRGGSGHARPSPAPVATTAGAGRQSVMRSGEHPRVLTDGRRASRATFEQNAISPSWKRLIECRAGCAGPRAGTRRGQQSAALLVVEKRGLRESLGMFVCARRVYDQRASDRGELRRLTRCTRAVRRDAARGLDRRRQTCGELSDRPRRARLLGLARP